MKLQRKKVAAGVTETEIAHRETVPHRRRGKEEASILTLRTSGEKIFFAFMFLLFAIYALSLIFPFFYMFFNALKDPYEYLLQDSHLALPEDWLFSNFAEAFTKMKIENSVGEAMLLGVPTVSSDVGGVKNLLTHGEEGLVYPYDEPKVLAYYIKRIFDDDDLARRFSENARKRAADIYDSEKNAQRLKEIYRAVQGEQKSE